MMVIKKTLLVISILIISLTSCNANSKQESPAQTMVVTQSPVENYNPYPIQITPTTEITGSGSTEISSAYPDPSGNHDIPVVSLYPQNFITNLVVPKPAAGMAVITGQFMKAGEEDKPYIAALFLAPVIVPDDTNSKPKIDYSRKSNRIAVQDLDSGRFLFTDVKPGSYAIVIWTPGKSIYLPGSDGKPLIIEGQPDQTNDLGVIFYQ